MIAINANLLTASEAGTGKPIFFITLYKYAAGAWSSLGDFDVIEARLTRLKVTIKVQEDLIDTPNIVSTSGLPYAITVTRGLTVAGTDYSYTSRKYFISQAEYLVNDGYTNIVADLLPNRAIRSIAADVTADTLIDNALTQVLITDFAAFTDAWEGWKFYPPATTLNIFDARSLGGLIANKYFAYLFPRTGGLYAYSIPANYDNAADGTYTPFAHARIKKLVSVDHAVNLSWTSETGKQYLTRSANYAYHSLGFISDADNPTAETYFPDWGQVFSKSIYEIIQRPDFRLEQGDLVTLSCDGFNYVRCLDLVEEFKRGKDPLWHQIIKDLPWHPQASASSIGDFPDDPNPKPSASFVKTSTDHFNNILSIDDNNVQEALETLDNLGQWGSWIPTFTGLTVGNGTLVARFTQVGKTVFFRISFILGNTSAVTGSIRFTVPVNFATYAGAGFFPIGTASLVDTATAEYVGYPTYYSATESILRFMTVSGSLLIKGTTNSAAPFTWTTGDIFLIQGYYEAA